MQIPGSVNRLTVAVPAAPQAQLRSPRARKQPPVAMETAGRWREQARPEMPASAPRGYWDLAEAPGILGGADAGVPAHSSTASVLERPELAPGQPGGFSVVRLGVQRRGCLIPVPRPGGRG